jgi:hypothetical protein
MWTDRTHSKEMPKKRQTVDSDMRGVDETKSDTTDDQKGDLGAEDNEKEQKTQCCDSPAKGKRKRKSLPQRGG